MCTSSSGSIIAPKLRKWELPPLILHPFDKPPGIGPEAIINEGLTLQELNARYAELRMLCFIGKDLNRWLEHCVELLATEPEHSGVTESSLIRYLLFDPPDALVRKMQLWEVNNYQLIFARALGLNSVFSDPPAPDEVPPRLLQDFHAYADALFDARLKLSPGGEIPDQAFEFEVYASGEYIALLEKLWNGLPES
jgi:hypothetical protein